jgi:hypothetical protein
VRWSNVVGIDGMVGKVTYCFGHDTEGRWGLDLSRGAGKGAGNELRFPFEFGENQGKTKAVQGLEEKLGEPILEVLFVCLWQAEFWVGMSDEPE